MVLALALLARETWNLSFGRLGIELSTPGLVVQATALVVGVIAINLTTRAKAREILIIQGVACLAAYGSIAIAWVWLLAAWWLLIGKATTALRIVVVVAITVVFAVFDPAHALVFALLFGMRLIIFTYDRWQNRHESEVLVGDFLIYVLPAPLIVVVPYFAIIPMFSTFATRFDVGLDRDKLGLAAAQLTVGAAAGVVYGAMTLWHPPGVFEMYWSLVQAIFELTVVACLAVALAGLHGIPLQHPVEGPFISTRVSELWRRTNLHLRDALFFLFYTPAALRLRRIDRFARIALVTGWTVLVGNTLLHVVLRYAYLDDGWSRTQHALVGNAVLAVAITLDLWHLEWHHDAPVSERSLVRSIAGGVIAFTVAAFAASL